MSIPYRVSVQGFSDFERSALASYFRLASNRTPAYAQVDASADARFLVVDSDNAEAMQAVLAAGRTGDAVFIGSQAPDGVSAWMMRPIDPLHVLRELDAMVAARGAARAGDAQLARPALPSVPLGVGRTRSTAPAAPAAGPVPARRAGDSDPVNLLAAADRAPLPAPPRAHLATRALLVDDSEIALRFLETRLRRFGISTDPANGSGAALELLARRAYDFVFLDVELGPASDLDGLALCQHIKRQHRPAGGAPAPVLVLVSAHCSELDRVRGALAGADAYLGKPLDETQLARLLAQHGVAAAAPATGRA